LDNTAKIIRNNYFFNCRYLLLGFFEDTGLVGYYAASLGEKFPTV